jgi:hypothetical protein
MAQQHLKDQLKVLACKQSEFNQQPKARWLASQLCSVVQHALRPATCSRHFPKSTASGMCDRQQLVPNLKPASLIPAQIILHPVSIA